jgi:hypothetical protein
MKDIEKSIDASVASSNARLDATFKEKEKDILTL